jgi:hypothetical protein
MVTQAYSDKGELVNRLMAQVKDRDFAINILQKRGDMDTTGNLTAKGESRNQMSAEERAIDREKKTNPNELVYNPADNTAKSI